MDAIALLFLLMALGWALAWLLVRFGGSPIPRFDRCVTSRWAIACLVLAALSFVLGRVLP